MIFIGSGWIDRWFIPAPTSKRRTMTSIRRRSENSIISAVNYASAQASACWTLVAVGARACSMQRNISALPIMLRAAESSGFEIRDVENLREHYALTLHHGLRRLEAHHAEARSLVDVTTYRVWRLYIAGSAHGFRRGRIAVYQTLFAKLDPSGQAQLPLTRTDWHK